MGQQDETRTGTTQSIRGHMLVAVVLVLVVVAVVGSDAGEEFTGHRKWTIKLSAVLHVYWPPSAPSAPTVSSWLVLLLPGQVTKLHLRR